VPGPDIERINRYLEDYLRETGQAEIKANRELDKVCLLKDSRDRPGKPLRDLCRKKPCPIQGAEQRPPRKGGNWFIRRVGEAAQEHPTERRERASTYSAQAAGRAGGRSREVLPDIVGKDLAIIFIGEAVGDYSASVGHYYAKQGNRFWDDLFSAGLTPRRLQPSEDSTLPRYGIGLTDVFKRLTNNEVKRERASGNLNPDSPVIAGARNALVGRIRECHPRAVCVLGRDAAEAIWPDDYRRPWGRQDSLILAQSQVWFSPSTSGQAREQYRPQRLTVWRQLKRSVVDPWLEQQRGKEERE